MTGSWQLFEKAPRAGGPAAGRGESRHRADHLGGVSFNKVFAKLGSDYKKPDATTLISRQNYRDILWPLPVGQMLFVGRSAKEKLQGLGGAHHRRAGGGRARHAAERPGQAGPLRSGAMPAARTQSRAPLGRGRAGKIGGERHDL